MGEAHTPKPCGTQGLNPDVGNRPRRGYLNEMTSVDVIDCNHPQKLGVEIWVDGMGR